MASLDCHGSGVGYLQLRDVLSELVQPGFPGRELGRHEGRDFLPGGLVLAAHWSAFRVEIPVRFHIVSYRRIVLGDPIESHDRTEVLLRLWGHVLRDDLLANAERYPRDDRA